MTASETGAAGARRQALRLEWITIGWNTIEVFVTIGLGVAARSLALVAFGLDSVIELFASLVVVRHLRRGGGAAPAAALRAVAGAFFALAAFLTVAAIENLVSGREPDPSPAGIVYLAATAAVMFVLARRKRKLGAALGDEPLTAEAAMTHLDGWLATGILTALVLNWALGWWWADPAAALLVAAAAINEGREAWTEAKSLPMPR